MHDNPRHEVQHTWAEIARAEDHTDDPDLTRSLIFFRAHMALPSRLASRRVLTWLTRFEELARFVREQDRMPRSGTGDELEHRLHSFARYQRRNQSDLCRYQQELLECLPHFDWSPLDSAWDQNLERYECFIAVANRRPSRRSPDEQEQRLAIWLRNQLDRQRHGTLPHHRVLDLRRVERAIKP